MAHSNISNLTDISTQISLWYQGNTGRKLYQDTNNVMRQWLKGSCGYCAVEMTTINSESIEKGDSWFIDSNIKSHYQIGVQAGNVIADFEHLPLDSESIDLVIVYHILEFTEPHQVLREVERVLVPEGRVIIILFNPFGKQAIKKLCTRKKTAPWNGKFYSAWRVNEWISVLGFHQEYAIGNKDYGMSLKFSRLFKYRMPWFNTLVMISACKRISRLTLIREKSRQRQFLKNNIVLPTSYSSVARQQQEITYDEKKDRDIH